jgi:hypothetical protein
VIKFTTLFGLLAVEIAVTIQSQSVKTLIGGFFFIIALVFIYRSFYSMRIPEEDLAQDEAPSELQINGTVSTKTGTASFVSEKETAGKN